MPKGDDRRPEGGFISVEFMVAVGFSFIFLVIMANYVVIQYGRGVVRAAADEGARAGAGFVTNPVAACTNRENDLLSGIGKMATDVTHKCVVVNNQIQATVDAKFLGWVPGIPDITEHSTAVSFKEQAPK